jgi:drug/metabolite transporter (DMT)-like permease
VVTTRRGVDAYRWELALVAVTAVWGSTFVLVRDAVAQVPPFTFIAYRFLAAALLLAAIRPRLAAVGEESLLAAGAVAGLALFAAGLACLSLQSLEVRQGDALVFGCAVAFAAHILLLGRYAPRHPSYPLAVVQLATIGLLALAWAGP